MPRRSPVPASLDMIAELSMRLPEGSQLAIGSRTDVPVPVARLRAQRGVVEVGTDQLAMDRPGAHALLAGAGVVGLTDPEVDHLVRRTEGWPAGLYLAALAMNAGSSHLAVTSTFTGDDRFIADYLRSEFLDRVSRVEALFLTRTSILERLTGPLCDPVVGRSGSSRLLGRLEARNLLVLPLDRTSGWYRYHHLFRELLHAELLRREPEMVTELHTRAATWYEANDLPEPAIDHAQRAGDADRVARLVLRIASPVWASGRVDTVLRWMEWFSDLGRLERQPVVAVHGALIFALVGRPGDAERWAEAAQRTTISGVQADGNTMEGTLAYLRALLCRDGLDDMRKDAQTALAGLAPTSPYRAAMLHAEGVADLLQGDLDRADVLFTRATDEATSAGVVPFVPLALAERGLVAIARDEWEEAEALAAQALEIMRSNQFDDYWTSALVYAWGHAWRLMEPTSSKLVSSCAELLGSAPCLPMPCRSCRPRPWCSWPTRTSRWPTLTGARRLVSSKTSSTTDPISAPCSTRPTSFARSSMRPEATCSAWPRSPPPSSGSSLSCRPISRWPRSASGCSSPGTPSRPRPSRCTASWASPAAARRSPACTSSASSPRPDPPDADSERAGQTCRTHRQPRP